MLFLLTGDIQTGKTRWLIRLVAALEAEGVAVEGVVAPGIWRSGPEGGFEKLGIENVLLPGNERLTFAMRGDLVADGEPGSAAAKPGWVFSDEAIDEVNRHFAGLHEARAANPGTGSRMLVVDEVGWLELDRGEGLIEAVALLEKGPQGEREHALVVVRPSLADRVEERFGPAWGETARILPDGDGWSLVLGTLSPSEA